MVTINVQYEGDLRCRAVHGPSGVELITDAPVDNHGRGESFSPTDLVATALASCMATVIGIKARQKGIDPVGMAIQVEKHMSLDSPRRIIALPITITIPLAADHPERPLLEAVAQSCPVLQSLHPAITKQVTWVWQA